MPMIFTRKYRRWLEWKGVFFFLALVLFLNHSTLSGQSSDKAIPCMDQLPEEEVSLFCDRDYYLAGDGLWFKAFVFLNGELSSAWSKVLYVELFNAKKEVSLQEKFLVVNGMVEGAIQLPADVPSGHYFLRAYTQYGRNFPVEKYFSKVLSIVNPLERGEDLELSKEDPGERLVVAKSTDAVEAESVQISLSKRTFHRREKVEIALKNEGQSQLAIVVRKKGTAYSRDENARFKKLNPWLNDRVFSAQSRSERNNTKTGNTADELKWIPELRSLSLSGILRDKTSGAPLGGESCITAIIGDEPQIHLSRSDEKGAFIFPYHGLYGEKDVYVSVRGASTKEMEILLNKDFSGDFPKTEPMLFDTSKHPLFEELYLNQQIQQYYSPLIEADSMESSGHNLSTFNLGRPDYVIKLKDFIALNTLADVFRELVPTVSVRGAIGSRRFSVFEKKMQRSHDDPLVLLDNVPVSDIEALLKINPDVIASIEVFDSEYQLGDFSFGGIVAINTTTFNFAGYKWTDSSVFLSYKTLHASKEFQIPTYDNPEALNSRKPDFRTVLYWNPSLNLDGKEETFSFYTSDHLAEYEIVIFGYSMDGQFFYGTNEIEVME